MHFVAVPHCSVAFQAAMPPFVGAFFRAGDRRKRPASAENPPSGTFSLRASCVTMTWMVLARVYPEGCGSRKMDVKQEIARQVEKLPPETQEQVLRFVASLAS